MQKRTFDTYLGVINKSNFAIACFLELMMRTNKCSKMFWFRRFFFLIQWEEEKERESGREERGRERKKRCVWLTLLNDHVIQLDFLSL